MADAAYFVYFSANYDFMCNFLALSSLSLSASDDSNANSGGGWNAFLRSVSTDTYFVLKITESSKKNVFQRSSSF